MKSLLTSYNIKLSVSLLLVVGTFHLNSLWAQTTTDRLTTPPSPEASRLQETVANKSFLDPFIYDAREGRRNPFRPYKIQSSDGEEMALGPATPLERFDIEEMSLLAVMWDIKNPKAMIMDPLKQIHTVFKNDRIGRKKGYIAAIREGEIVIVETTEFNGETVFSTRTLAISK